MITVLIHLAQGLTQPVVTNFAVHCSNHPRWFVLVYADRFSRDAINKCGEAILLCMVQITLGELCYSMLTGLVGIPSMNVGKHFLDFLHMVWLR